MPANLRQSAAEFPAPIAAKTGTIPAHKVSGRTIVMALRTEGNQRYSWMKNRRSLLVNWTRPRTWRCSTISCCLSAAFSASSQLLGLNNDAPRLKRKNISATIAADVKRFCHQIKNGQGFRYTQLFGREVCPLSARADIYFPLYVPPLRRAAQSADHLLKGIGVFGGVLEPSQEVEWLSKFSAVMQTSRYRRQVFHTNSNVPRLLLEDGSAFILR